MCLHGSMWVRVPILWHYCCLIVEQDCLNELVARLPLGYLLPTGFNGPLVFLICISVQDAMRNKSYYSKNNQIIHSMKIFIFFLNAVSATPNWWRPCIQRSRSMIPQQTRNVGKILSSESLPLWFAVDFRLPRIWKLRKFVENR